MKRAKSAAKRNKEEGFDYGGSSIRDAFSYFLFLVLPVNFVLLLATFSPLFPFVSFTSVNYTLPLILFVIFRLKEFINLISYKFASRVLPLWVQDNNSGTSGRHRLCTWNPVQSLMHKVFPVKQRLMPREREKNKNTETEQTNELFMQRTRTNQYNFVGVLFSGVHYSLFTATTDTG